MASEQLIVSVERFRDEVQELRQTIRKQYARKKSRITARTVRKQAESLAEKWMVEFAIVQELGTALSPEYLSNLNVHFQRLLTLSEGVATRAQYENELDEIMTGFNAGVIIPLKQRRDSHPELSRGQIARPTERFSPTAFVGHSFANADALVVSSVLDTLREIGLRVVTGERPKAERISEKVKRLIDDQYLFVGLFTRRDKIARKPEWTTSPWVIDEKAYAFGQGKKLILLKEDGVSSIGGIQGDYEYVEFNRSRLEVLALALLRILDVRIMGLRQ